MKAIKPNYGDGEPDPKKHFPTHTVVEESLWDAWLKAVQAELDDPIEELADLEDAPEVHFDGGGMVHAKEPRVEVTIDGCKFTCYARQVEFLVPGLRRIKTNPDIPDLGEYVSTRGRWWQFVLTKETAAKIADEFEKQAAEKAGEIDAVWSHLENNVNAPNADGKIKAFTATRDQTKKRHKEANRRDKFKEN
jgi:hypothetical protein